MPATLDSLASQIAALDGKVQSLLDALTPRKTGPNADLEDAITGSVLFSSPWKDPIDGLPPVPDSPLYLQTYGKEGLNPVFGYDWNGYPQGMPYNVADSSIPAVPVVCTQGKKTYTLSARIADSFQVENPTDSHLLVVDRDARTLTELFQTRKLADGWHSGGGVQWSLDAPCHAQRREGLDSADAAGLPMLPGVIRRGELDRALPDGDLGHAIRFAYPCNGNYPGYYKLPAHATPNNYADILKWKYSIPMGARIRLKKSFDVSEFSPVNRVILRTLQRYGGIVADGTDRGQGWSFQGHPDPAWDGDDLQKLRVVGPDQLEVVDDGLLGPAWRVEVSGGPYVAGSPVAFTATLIQPPPGTDKIALAISLKDPQATSYPANPWVLDFPAADGSPKGTAKFTPPVPGNWTVNFQSWAGNNFGRLAPPPITLTVADKTG